MNNIKRIILPLSAKDFLNYIEIPKLHVYCEETLAGYYEVDEVYAPVILKNMDNLDLLRFPDIDAILEIKCKMNHTFLPF